MDRFFSRKSGSSPGGTSSSGGGGRPDPDNAEQLAVKIECLQDVGRWLATGKVSSSDLEMGSVREAVAALTRKPRPRRVDVRPLLGKWRVQQKRQQEDRPLAEIIRDLEDKVIRAAQKLQAELASKPETTLVIVHNAGD